MDVVFIAAQKIDGITGGRKFIEKRGYRFPILFDAERETTRAFGVYHLVGIDAFRIAYPAAFLIDPSGKILWIAVSRSQTELPTIDEFLSAIDK